MVSTELATGGKMGSISRMEAVQEMCVLIVSGIMVDETT